MMVAEEASPLADIVSGFFFYLFVSSYIQHCAPIETPALRIWFDQRNMANLPYISRHDGICFLKSYIMIWEASAACLCIVTKYRLDKTKKVFYERLNGVEECGKLWGQFCMVLSVFLTHRKAFLLRCDTLVYEHTVRIYIYIHVFCSVIEIIFHCNFAT